YAASLVAWLIAFTTYTIQCGAMLAVAYLALRTTLPQTPFDGAQSGAPSTRGKKVAAEAAAADRISESAVIFPNDSKHRVLRGFFTAAADTAPYAAFFGLFLLIWQTTVSPHAVGALSLNFTLGGLFASLREGVWHSDFS